MLRFPILPAVALALVLHFSAGSAFAQLTPGQAAQTVQINAITTAVPFLTIAPDSRSGALGDAGVALSPDGNSLHWNPAKMAFMEDDVEFTMSYAPWLRELVDDMNLAYESGTTIRDFKPAEFSLDAGFSQRFTDRFGGGVTGRFINSNLTGGTNVLGANSKPGRSVAVDVGLFYTNPKAQLGGKKGVFNLGMNVSNIGAKMSYTESADRDFIPANLRLGTAYELFVDEYNSLTFTVDANKLLVPTPPIMDQESGTEIVSGYDANVGVATAIVQSFYDAPGVVDFNEDGTYAIQEGSILREELREYNLGGGIEYNYNDVFAFRSGFFNEHYSKGNRQFITLGAGIKYTVFTVDLSYLISTRLQNPLANTLRFTLRLQFADLVSSGGENVPE
jgi:hypothetical protein